MWNSMPNTDFYTIKLEIQSVLVFEKVAYNKKHPVYYLYHVIGALWQVSGTILCRNHLSW